MSDVIIQVGFNRLFKAQTLIGNYYLVSMWRDVKDVAMEEVQMQLLDVSKTNSFVRIKMEVIWVNDKDYLYFKDTNHSYNSLQHYTCYNYNFRLPCMSSKRNIYRSY